MAPSSGCGLRFARVIPEVGPERVSSGSPAGSSAVTSGSTSPAPLGVERAAFDRVTSESCAAALTESLGESLGFGSARNRPRP